MQRYCIFHQSNAPTMIKSWKVECLSEHLKVTKKQPPRFHFPLIEVARILTYGKLATNA